MCFCLVFRIFVVLFAFLPPNKLEKNPPLSPPFFFSFNFFLVFIKQNKIFIFVFIFLIIFLIMIYFIDIYFSNKNIKMNLDIVLLKIIHLFILIVEI